MIGATGDSHLAVRLIYPLRSPCRARSHKASLVLFAVKGPSMSKACVCFFKVCRVYTNVGYEILQNEFMGEKIIVYFGSCSTLLMKAF